MSRVFLANETALGRSVVVKILSGDVVADISAERFAREVRLAASLQHPNIVPVLTTGVADGIPYYTMPYVRGESLRARTKSGATLSRRESVSILRDMARALQYAHSDGVVHRDIKPDNVLLSGDAAMVTDFGIAKAISAARTSSSQPVVEGDGRTLTQAGLTIGTPAYMAPEQAAGDTIDHRVDIYAWGMVAYEILAGAHPFAEKTTAAQLMVAQLMEKPANLSEKASDISPALSDLVMLCLEKAPEKRPASATELLDGLDNAYHSRESATFKRAHKTRRPIIGAIAAAAVLIAIVIYALVSRQGNTKATGGASSVAVLPFADARADSTNAYFGEGIADELMTSLGKVPGIRVASRTSSHALGRRTDLDVRDIGRQLGVSTVVEGTIRRSGEHLRVTAQLTNVSDGLTLWSNQYERTKKDVFALQDEITQAILVALRPELASGQTAAQKAAMGPGTSNLEAYDLYLRGLYLVEKRGSSVPKAAEYFAQAIKQDSMFARAYAGLADALEFFPYFTGVPTYRVEPRVRAAAERSLKLDPTLAEPRVALAMAHWHAFRWGEAEAEFRRALAADSASPVARTQYGRFLLSRGQVADALREFRIARRLDPLAATASVWLAYSLSRSGDEAGGRTESKRARELDPDLVTTYTVLAVDRVGIGRPDEARAIAGSRMPPIPFNGLRAYVLHKSGDTAGAAAIRKSLDAAPDSTWMIHMGRVFGSIATDDTTKVLTELEAAFKSRELVAQWIPFVDHMFDPIRRSARFAALLRNMGLEGRGLEKVK